MRIFAKLEGTNPSGSIKDRIALGLVNRAERRGDLKPGMALVEAEYRQHGHRAGHGGAAARLLHYGHVTGRGCLLRFGDTLKLLGANISWCKPCAGHAWGYPPC